MPLFSAWRAEPGEILVRGEPRGERAAHLQPVHAVVPHEVEQPVEAVAVLDGIAFHSEVQLHGTNTTLLKNSLRAEHTPENVGALRERGAYGSRARATLMRVPR